MITWSDLTDTSRGGQAYVYGRCHGKIITGMIKVFDVTTSP